MNTHNLVANYMFSFTVILSSLGEKMIFFTLIFNTTLKTLTIIRYTKGKKYNPKS